MEFFKELRKAIHEAEPQLRYTYVAKVLEQMLDYLIKIVEHQMLNNSLTSKHPGRLQIFIGKQSHILVSLLCPLALPYGTEFKRFSLVGFKQL